MQSKPPITFEKCIFAAKYDKTGEYYPDGLVTDLMRFFADLEYTDTAEGAYQLWDYPSGKIYDVVPDRELYSGDYSTPYGPRGTVWQPVLKYVKTDPEHVSKLSKPYLKKHYSDQLGPDEPLKKSHRTRLTKALNLLKEKGFKVTRVSPSLGEAYEINGKNYLFKLILGSSKWLSLQLYSYGERQWPRLLYETGSGSSKAPHTQAVVDEVSKVLESLAEGLVIASRGRGKNKIIIPKDDSYLLITDGKLFAKKTQYGDMAKLKAKGDFLPLTASSF